MAKMTEEHKTKMRVAKEAAASLREKEKDSKGDTLMPEGSKERARYNIAPETAKATYCKAVEGKSKTAAIKAFCQMCMGWENMIYEITNCTDPACPLYKHRPYR